MGLYAQRIKEKIEKNLSPSSLVIRDDSARHEGHGGAHPEGETHFHLTIVSEAFRPLSPVARHRLVYSLLEEELRERVHALSLDLRSPA